MVKVGNKDFRFCCLVCLNLPVSQQLAEINNLKTWNAFFSDRKKKYCLEPSLPTGSRVSALATAVIISQLRLKPARVCSSVSPDKLHEPRLAAHINYRACVRALLAHTQGGKEKRKNTANMWLPHNRARTHSRTLRINTQITRWEIAAALLKIPKKVSVFFFVFFLKEGKKICRLAEARDSECRRVESMSKQSESRREPGDTEEAQRIWLSLEPWQGILADCAYMCVCLISPAEGVNAVIQNGGICVKPQRRTGSRLCFVLSRSGAPSQENIKTKGVAGKHSLSFQELKIPSVSVYNAGLQALGIGNARPCAKSVGRHCHRVCDKLLGPFFSRNCRVHCYHWLENCKGDQTRYL